MEQSKIKLINITDKLNKVTQLLERTTPVNCVLLFIVATETDPTVCMFIYCWVCLIPVAQPHKKNFHGSLSLIRQLTFSYFHLEPHTTCNWDSVTIFNGGSPGSPIIGQYCGTTSPGTIQSGSNKLAIVFLADHSVSAGGFVASWSTDSSGVFTLAKWKCCTWSLLIWIAVINTCCGFRKYSETRFIICIQLYSVSIQKPTMTQWNKTVNKAS